MKSMHYVMHLLVIVGGLNWGLVGLGNWMGNAPDSWNVVRMLLVQWPMVENLVYVLVGLSALMMIFSMKKDCRECNPSGMM